MVLESLKTLFLVCTITAWIFFLSEFTFIQGSLEFENFYANRLQMQSAQSHHSSLFKEIHHFTNEKIRLLSRSSMVQTAKPHTSFTQKANSMELQSQIHVTSKLFWGLSYLFWNFEKCPVNHLCTSMKASNTMSLREVP